MTDGVVSGTTITSASSNFTTLAIDFGHVAVISDVPHEIISRGSTTQLTVSLPRSATTEPLVEPAPGTGLRLKVPSFKRLSDLAEAWVLGALGIDSKDPLQPLQVSAILNQDAVKNLIALRTIKDALAISFGILPSSDVLGEQLKHYASRLAEARAQTEIYLDLDGDGQADAIRRIDLVTFVRA